MYYDSNILVNPSVVNSSDFFSSYSSLKLLLDYNWN